jgi:hypothetical protein
VAQVCQAPLVTQQGNSNLRLRIAKLMSQLPVRVVRAELPPAAAHPEELAELHPAGIPIPAHPEAQNPPEDQKALVARAAAVAKAIAAVKAVAAGPQTAAAKAAAVGVARGVVVKPV